MENQRIKDNRRAKFLAKIENKNRINKNEANQRVSYDTNYISNPQNNNFGQNTNYYYNQSYQSLANNNFNNINYNSNNFQPNFNPSNNHFNNNSNNYQQNNYINNRFQQNQPKINYNELLEQLSQFDYMINFQSIFKKILLIILAIIHCLNYPPLENSFVFKYTLFVLEMSSLFFNKYYNDQKKSLTDRSLQTNNNNMNGQPIEQIEQIEKIFQFLNDNFKYFNFLITFIKFIKDLIIDFSILYIINIIFLIIKKEE